MPGNALILVVILAGYLFIHLSDYFHYRAKTLEGHRLVIEASVAGLILFAVTRALMVGVFCPLDSAYWGGSLHHQWRKFAGDTPFVGSLFLSNVIAVLIGLGTNLKKQPRLIERLRDWWRGRTRFSRSRALRKAILKSGDRLIKLLLDAATSVVEESTMVGVTMEDRKLYVGWVFRLPTLEIQEKYLELYPIMSGFRDPDTLLPHFNFFYHTEGPQSPVIIPIDKIQTVRLLDKKFTPQDIGLGKDVKEPPENHNSEKGPKKA